MKTNHTQARDFGNQFFKLLQTDFQTSFYLINIKENLVMFFYLLYSQYTTATTAKISQPLMTTPFLDSLWPHYTINCSGY